MKKTKKMPKPKKGAWFVKLRGSYIPCSWQGWLTYIPFLIFLITTLVAAVQGQETITGVLFMIFPEWIAAAVVMTWVASARS